MRIADSSELAGARPVAWMAAALLALCQLSLLAITVCPEKSCSVGLASTPGTPKLQEHVWDELREKEFPNRVFSDLASVIDQLEAGLPRLASNRKGLRSLTAWPWILSLNLNAI